MMFNIESDDRTAVRRQLAEIAKTLGPERCQSALNAFRHPEQGAGWVGCALARAYGERQEFLAAFNEYHRARSVGSISGFAAEVFGLTGGQVGAAIQAFDMDEVWVRGYGEDAVYVSGARDMFRDALAAEARKIQPGRLRKAIEAVAPQWLKDMMGGE